MKADNQNTTISCGIDISYGLTIAGINGDYDTYLNKYTSKEFQTGEFDPMLSTGLEMLDFGSRFYDPQLGRWFTPDPAEQFANPYLAMGNNPVVYVDPDGEWVHLAIGAVIGGTLNLLTNLDNINNFWDGAKYFGVGAAAGALAAGVGAGISSTMAGGSFGSGFIGSQAAMSVSSSFVSGATIGAGSGFTGGFVSGFGNTGIQGGNIGQMFGTGLEYGWKGAVSGAIVGGISGGIDASRDGRNFWNGKSPAMEYRLDGYELIYQNDPMSCKDATCASMDKLNGGNRSQQYFKEKGAEFLKENPNATLEEYFKHFGFDVRDPVGWGPQQIGKGMELGNPTVISEKITTNQQHTLTITRIRQWTPNSKIKVWFADPARGSWSRSWQSTVGNPNFNDGGYLFWLNR